MHSEILFISISLAFVTDHQPEHPVNNKCLQDFARNKIAPHRRRKGFYCAPTVKVTSVGVIVWVRHKRRRYAMDIVPVDVLKNWVLLQLYNNVRYRYKCLPDIRYFVSTCIQANNCLIVLVLIYLSASPIM